VCVQLQAQAASIRYEGQATSKTPVTAHSHLAQAARRRGGDMRLEYAMAQETRI